MINSAHTRFRALFGSRKPAARGRAFEALVREALEGEDFEVTVNPKVSAPRQSDLLAARGEREYLIECRWQNKLIGSPDIAGLSDRLRRAPTGITGVFISMSDYNDEAQAEALRGRNEREILLFAPYEVDRFLSGSESISTLLRRKRTSIRRQGKLWFLDKELVTFSKLLRLPKLNSTTMTEGSGHAARAISARTQSANLIFTRHIPDVRWNEFNGQAVCLKLNIDLRSVEQLEDLLARLHTRFGLPGDGAFAIHQTKASWFGSGANHFIIEIGRWQDRYLEMGLASAHGSEQLEYFDRFWDGSIHLFGCQRLISAPHLDDLELVIRLPGIPIDTSSLQKLAEETRNAGARFVGLGETRVHLHRFRKPVQLDVLGLVHTGHDDTAICGVVANNPYFGKPDLASRTFDHPTEDYGSPISLIWTTEKLVCSLADFHDPSEVPYRYFLRHIEAEWTTDGAVIRPVAWWPDLPGRTTRERLERSQKPAYAPLEQTIKRIRSEYAKSMAKANRVEQVFKTSKNRYRRR